MVEAELARVQDVFRRHHRWVRRVAQKQFGIAAADADDVVQMVFVVASQVLENEPVHSEKAWLLAVTRRVCANERRRFRTRRDFEAQYGQTVSTLGWHGVMPMNETHLALSGLTPAQRDVLTLVCADGLSMDSVASRLGLSPRVAALRLETAKSALRRQLELSWC